MQYGRARRMVVLARVEQAADAMSQLTGALGRRLSAAAERALVAATGARRADTLFDADGDVALLAARDEVLAALAAAGVSELPSSCRS